MHEVCLQDLSQSARMTSSPHRVDPAYRDRWSMASPLTNQRWIAPYICTLVLTRLNFDSTQYPAVNRIHRMRTIDFLELWGGLDLIGNEAKHI